MQRYGNTRKKRRVRANLRRRRTERSHKARTDGLHLGEMRGIVLQIEHCGGIPTTEPERLERTSTVLPTTILEGVDPALNSEPAITPGVVVSKLESCVRGYLYRLDVRRDG